MKVDYGRADPTSCEELLILEEATPDEIDEIIAKSLTAQKIWAKLSGFQRLGYLQSIIHEIISHINPLIRILAIEIGMPISEAKEETFASRFVCAAGEMKEMNSSGHKV